MWEYDNLNGDTTFFGLPHRFELRCGRCPSRAVFVDTRTEVRAWCREQWGEPGRDNVVESRYTVWGYENITLVILIRDEDDAFEFRMRWT